MILPRPSRSWSDLHLSEACGIMLNFSIMLNYWFWKTSCNILLTSRTSQIKTPSEISLLIKSWFSKMVTYLDEGYTNCNCTNDCQIVSDEIDKGSFTAFSVEGSIASIIRVAWCNPTICVTVWWVCRCWFGVFRCINTSTAVKFLLGPVK